LQGHVRELLIVTIKMTVKHTGSCHCGAVKIECVTDSSDIEIVECNCSICEKKGFLHLIVKSFDKI
jgi:hypothetical protein